MDRKYYKDAAKGLLQKHLWNLFIGILLVMIVSGIVGAISKNLYAVLTLLVSGHLAVGLSALFLRAFREDRVDLNDLTWGFVNKQYVRVLIITLVKSLLVLLWTLLFIIPGIIKAIEYMLVENIAVDNPDMDPMEVLKESQRLMDGRKMDAFILSLSFLGWILLVAVTFGIAIIYVAPYIQATFTAFYIDITSKEDIRVEEVVDAEVI